MTRSGWDRSCLVPVFPSYSRGHSLPFSGELAPTELWKAAAPSASAVLILTPPSCVVVI